MTRTRLWALVPSLLLVSPGLVSADGPRAQTYAKEGHGSVSIGKTWGVYPALMQFDLKFTNGDHKVRRVGVWQMANAFDADMADGNADDPMAFEGQYLFGVGANMQQKLQKSCRGACTIALEGKPGPGYVPVLLGFSFDRTGGDSNVRVASVRVTDDDSAYRVEFRDNGTFDYRYDLQYAWVRGTKETANGTRTESQRNSEIQLSPTSTQTGHRLIQGFSFTYLNGDHHLKDMAVRRSNTNRFSVRFNDGNTDDPVRATVDIVTPQ